MTRFNIGDYIYDEDWNAIGLVQRLWSEARIIYVRWLTSRIEGQSSDFTPNEKTHALSPAELTAVAKNLPPKSRGDIRLGDLVASIAPDAGGRVGKVMAIWDADHRPVGHPRFNGEVVDWRVRVLDTDAGDEIEALAASLVVVTPALFTNDEEIT